MPTATIDAPAPVDAAAGILQPRVYKNPVGDFTLELQDYSIAPSKFKDSQGRQQTSVELQTVVVDEGEFKDTPQRIFLTIGPDGIGSAKTVANKALSAFIGAPINGPVNLPELKRRGARVKATLREKRTEKGVWSRPVVNKDEVLLTHAGYARD